MVDMLSVGSAVVAAPEAAAAFVVAGLSELGERRPLLVVTATVADAERIAHDVAAFLGDDAVELFPAWDTLPFERVSPETATIGRRLRVLWRLGVGRGSDDHAGQGRVPEVVVAPVRALLQRLGPVEHSAVPVAVARGERLDQAELVERLIALGYRREYQVEHRGELAVRGGIVDVFPSDAELPVRIDLWGDEVDRLTEFDPGDQRSRQDVSSVELHGCHELLPTEDVRRRAEGLLATARWGAAQWERIAEGQLFDGMESWTPWLAGEERLLPDLLPETARVVLVDPRRSRDRSAELLDEERALAATLAITWGAAASPAEADGADGEEDRFPPLHLDYGRLLAHCPAPVLSLVPNAEGPGTPTVAAQGWDPVLGDRSLLARRLAGLAEQGYSVTVCAEGAGSAARLAAVLREEGLSIPVVDGDGALAAPGVRVVVAAVDRGFVAPAAKVAVLAESDLTGRLRPHRGARARARATDGFFDDLAPGDFVVHRQHGVARYAGMVTRTVNGASRDYLLLEYRGDDRLYLPSDQIEAITPYSGGESPTLSRLGGTDWSRTRARARAAVHEVAKELVELYRTRMQISGHAYPPDTPWQSELEEAFAYIETVDQMRAIEDVKADMEGPAPMDRLVCGDVGFGKTEVAVRAAFKAVQDGLQVAVLVPTTLLAQQHSQTFADRYAGFPVRVEMLSRFLTPAQARQVVNGLADGSVDVVVGTHRLLASDVRFKRLGLLVVDEEQRFGVSHKEAIKALSSGVDVLTLTASPIPRTLEMALTGIREMSLINTPPAERQPILTYVGEYDEAAVTEALRRELLREGQAFFVHNWVQDIEAVAARLRELVPEARVAVAHGQMDEGTLEKVVLDFWEKRYDVLVCTTIIESGIDMPTVNTLVVDRADRLGLGQLHQLRGRVGRSGQRAYAYLFHPVDRTLTEAAYERLRTIGEHTELGSGFKIAMRDLEIRGAGNLLGRDQSGHIAAVGYDLYVQLVAEAVAELKGEPLRPPVEVTIDIPSDAHLPTDYVAREDVRLEAYRRLAAVDSAEVLEDIRTEWTDRFGPLPAPAEGLLEVAALRVQCLRTGVREVSVTAPRGPVLSGRRRTVVARLSPLELAASARVRLRRLYPDSVYKEEPRQLQVTLDADGVAAALAALLEALVPPPVPAEATEVPADSSLSGVRR